VRTIIAGSREIEDPAVVGRAVAASGFVPSVVLCGMARGVDMWGRAWAHGHGVPVEEYPADWNIHGKAAGPIRNQEMAENADALIAVWDGESRGTRDMIKRALARGLKVHIYDLSARALGDGE
jgi:hypothetical protein